MSGNWDLRRSRLRTIARLEIGDVLLTASITEVTFEIIFGVVARNTTLTEKLGEGEAGDTSQFDCLSKRQNALGVERDSEFCTQTGLNFRGRQSFLGCLR